MERNQYICVKVILNDRIDCFPIHIVFICLSSTNLSSIYLPSSCNHLVACHHHACHHDVSIPLLVINMLAIIRLSSNCVSSSYYHPIACHHPLVTSVHLSTALISPPVPFQVTAMQLTRMGRGSSHDGEWQQRWWWWCKWNTTDEGAIAPKALICFENKCQSYYRKRGWIKEEIRRVSWWCVTMIKVIANMTHHNAIDSDGQS